MDSKSIGLLRRGSNPLGVVLTLLLLLLLLLLLQTCEIAFAPRLPWAFAHHLLSSPAHGTESKRVSRGACCIESARTSEEDTSLANKEAARMYESARGARLDLEGGCSGK